MRDGALIWRRWPANQVFIDGRYDGVLFDSALLKEFIQAHTSRDALEELRARYGFNVVISSTRPGS